jgi:DNA mismatch endonuclease, patch repair protein
MSSRSEESLVLVCNPILECVNPRVPYKRVERNLVRRRRPTTTVAHSLRMAAIRQCATSPELVVRHVATSLGLHYRTVNKDLAGSPDLANRTRRWAVFVHGCFWHRHHRCAKSTIPRTNRAFWFSKFVRNVERDARVQTQLRGLGYLVLVIWECETNDIATLRKRLGRLLKRQRMN